ncbi:MAG: hypothetical protein ACU0BB_04680 [Paracoccaceae bacterium]
MNQILKLEILDGSQVGQKVEVPSEKCSVGGQGSAADLELSGLPYGIKFIDLVNNGKHWSMVEFEPRSALLNQKQLKRRNKLSVGDEISLPSTTAGMPFRMTVELEAVKKQKSGSGDNILGKVNGTVMIVVVVYLLAMIGAGIFLVMNEKTSGTARQIAMSDVTSALDADLGKLSNDGAAHDATVPLTNRAANYDQLGLFLAQDISLARKSQLRDEFRNEITDLFSEAWRFEQQKRWGDAQAKYQRVAEIMGDRDLQTTELALVKARQANRR